MTNAVEIKDLSKTYKDFKLDNINLNLPSGCILGLIGENGAGKSTTIKLMLDMINRDSGEITILGKSNKDNFRLTKEDIGVVLDEIGFNSTLTAKQIGKVMALSYKNWDNDVYNGFLEKLSIPYNKKFKEFSRGMKMKFGIAVAMSHNPKLLILDEATNGLDPVVRDEITDLFLEFTRDENHSILISSHIVSDLEKICDYIAFMHKGRIMLCEEKDRLREEYTLIKCSSEQFADIEPSAVIGRRETAYGTEAIVKRSEIPAGMDGSIVTIEELFVFMVKGDK